MNLRQTSERLYGYWCFCYDHSTMHISDLLQTPDQESGDEM